VLRSILGIEQRSAGDDSMRAPSVWQRLASQRISRRRALKAGVAAGLGIAGLSLAGCGEEKEPAVEATSKPSTNVELPVRQEFVPSNDAIYGDIQQIFAQGVRRPGYPADRWAEQFCLERFNELDLENVRNEPVEVPYWEPRNWSLSVWGESLDIADGLDLDCFPLPHSAPTSGLEGQLVTFDTQSPALARGSIALQDVPLMHVPHAYLASLATWYYDPEGTFANSVQVLPFSPQFQEVMEPVIAAGASGFVGALTGCGGGGSRRARLPPHPTQKASLSGQRVAGSSPVPASTATNPQGSAERPSLCVGASPLDSSLSPSLLRLAHPDSADF
jgi:hypothetical protein